VRYPKEVVLKEGKEAVIRPLEQQDESLLARFYADLPDSDRWFMRYDVLDPIVIRKWIDGIATATVYSIVAISEDKIVGHASLHIRGFGCTRHIGRIRVMILPPFRHIRLGTWMLLDLIQLGMDKGLEELRTDLIVGVENPAIESAHKMDFFERGLLKDYIKDSDGNHHDLVIMTKRLHKNWGDF
jgi:L-amino acid N-acyltransferase YncA